MPQKMTTAYLTPLSLGGGFRIIVSTSNQFLPLLSVGLEILDDLPDPDVIAVCCGGGGLVAGIAAAVKLSGNAKTRIYCVEPENGMCCGCCYLVYDLLSPLSVYS